MECPPGQRWDFGPCGCVPIECPGVESCPENQAFDESCSCQCTLTQEKCDEINPGSFLSECECLTHVDPCFQEEPCPPGLRWEQSVCNCVAIECPDVQCEENYVFDESCNCVCGIDESSCQAFEEFSSESCACFPKMGCDYIMECPLGQRWDRSDDVCACVPVVCETFAPCEENYMFDENCNCQCPWTQERCDEEMPGTQLIGCGCVYVDPCPPQPCADGEQWDSLECSCVIIFS
jgi:hypothetical protein